MQNKRFVIYFLSLDLKFTRKTLLCILTQLGNAPSNINFNDTENMKEHFKKTHMINTNRNQQFLNCNKI